MSQYGEIPYWAALRDYLPGGKPVPHIHKPEEYHYIYVLEGGDRIRIGHDAFALTPGVLYLTAPGICHSFSSCPNRMLITIELKFVLTDPWLREQTAQLPPVVEDPTGDLRLSLERILKEAETPKPYRREVMEAELRTLLYHLLRRTHKESSSSETAAEAALQPVLRYIRENLHCPITLEDLAAAAHLEKSYFSRKFKAISGSTPMDYLRQVRLAKARELLRYSDMTVTQVAQALGFRSLHHFSKAFRQFTGISPMAYKTGGDE